MAFHDHRPNKRLGRSERPLVKLTKDLTSFLTKAQRSLTYDTLHLSSRQRGVLAHILVEFAEDLYQDIGIWTSLEQCNLDFFGTRLPCVLQPDETMDALPVNPERVQFLLRALSAEMEPDLILAPKEEVEAFLKRHNLSEPAPPFEWAPDLLECDDGIGVYFNPDEGQEIMMSFDDVLSGFQKRGGTAFCLLSLAFYG